MKSLRIFVLTLLFLHSKTGLALNLHFCGDHLASISWAFNAKGCGMEPSTQQNTDSESVSKALCCNDSTLIAQDHSPQTSESADAESIGKIFLAASELVCTAQKQIQGADYTILIFEPPSNQKRYKRFCQFIFYG